MDIDWELEGEGDCGLKDGDGAVGIPRLNGGQNTATGNVMQSR
jgi:hypothetical protein